MSLAAEAFVSQMAGNVLTLFGAFIIVSKASLHQLTSTNIYTVKGTKVVTAFLRCRNSVLNLYIFVVNHN